MRQHFVHAQLPRITALIAVLAAGFGEARADAITDWNLKAGEIVIESKIGTPPAIRVMAIVQTAALDAVNAAPGASIDAAVAAANRATLSKLLPAQQTLIDAAYQAALTPLADGPAKTAGIAHGERAAAAVLAARADDNAAAPEAYRPHTTPGAYVPTAAPAVPQWAQRKPWLMTSPAQFRAGPPPALASELWARDFNEIKAFGGKTSTRRTGEQTETARFWEYSLPPIYHGLLRSAAVAPGRDVARNARLFAAASQAMDDALISVFEAKYQYNFWRPVTAIRNADIDGNDATVREPSWASLIESPMHPEYPSGHGVLAGAIAAVLRADQAGGPAPVLATSSPSAKGATRRWTSIDQLVREISDARIYGGLHFRFSTDAAVAMGQQIGELAAARYVVAPQ